MHISKTIIEELSKAKDILDKINYTDLVEILNAYLPKIPICIYDFKNEPYALNQHHSGGVNLLYRARVNDKGTNAPYASVEDISYVPLKCQHKIKYFGRVNKPNNSMFYCSSDYSTACIETFSKGVNFDLIKERGSIMLTMGVWEVLEDLTLTQMIHSEKYFSEFREKVKNLEAIKISPEYVKEVNEKTFQMIGDGIEYEILKFFSDEFAKTDTHNDYEYKLSNYYADRVFDRIRAFNLGEKIDGIMYPSIAAIYDEYNIVMPPETVDKKLKFLEAIDMWIIWREKENRIDFKQIGRRSPDKEGRLNW